MNETMLGIIILLLLTVAVLIIVLKKYIDNLSFDLRFKLKSIENTLSLIEKNRSKIEVPLPPKRRLIIIRKLKSMNWFLVYEKSGNGYFIQNLNKINPIIQIKGVVEDES